MIFNSRWTKTNEKIPIWNNQTWATPLSSSLLSLLSSLIIMIVTVVINGYWFDCKDDYDDYKYTDNILDQIIIMSIMAEWLVSGVHIIAVAKKRKRNDRLRDEIFGFFYFILFLVEYWNEFKLWIKISNWMIRLIVIKMINMPCAVLDFSGFFSFRFLFQKHTKT